MILVSEADRDRIQETSRAREALKLDRLFRDAIDALTCTRDWDQRGVSLHWVLPEPKSLRVTSRARSIFLFGEK